MTDLESSCSPTRPRRFARIEPAPSCLRDEDIALYHDGGLDRLREAEIRAHIAECGICRELVAALAPIVEHESSHGTPTLMRTSQVAAVASWGKPGEVFAEKYVVEGVLGEGGMGRVLSARHIELERPVAIKVIHSEWARDPDSSRRLVREARAAANLSSKNIACVYDLGRTPNGLPFIVMERLFGSDLGQLVRNGPLPPEKAVPYMIQALAALREAHARGIIHRDLKPQNIFLTKGPTGHDLIKILDFGLAKDFARSPDPNVSSKLTGMHMMLGSPHFMSPEQIRDAREVDARSDIWSIGATLYLLLTGRYPFVAPNAHVVCAKILSDKPESMLRYRRNIPQELDRIVLRCMARDPAARFASAEQLERALRDCLKPAPAEAPAPPSIAPPTIAPFVAAPNARPAAALPITAPVIRDRPSSRQSLAMTIPPVPRPVTPVLAPLPAPVLPYDAQPVQAPAPSARVSDRAATVSGTKVWRAVLAFAAAVLATAGGFVVESSLRAPSGEVTVVPSGTVVQVIRATPEPAPDARAAHR
jgi:eukaryotic-like serine/threonine-protein kinase